MGRRQPAAAGNPLTGPSTGNYSFRMNGIAHGNEVQQELQLLESRLEQLLGTVAQLQEENRALRQRHESLASEKTALLSRNDQVRARVEAMIGRLKAMEHSA